MGERMRRFGRRASAQTFRLMDRGRDKRAFDAATLPPTRSDFAQFTGRQCLLVTYRKSGQPMPSPVNFGISDGKLYVRSERDTGKVTRLRNNPRILPSEEAARADAIVAANWSPGMRLLERSLDVGAKVFEQNTVYIAFTPLAR